MNKSIEQINKYSNITAKKKINLNSKYDELDKRL